MKLTSIANVKSWLNLSSTTDDQLLQRLISAESARILQYLQRPDIVRTSITENMSGRGTRRVQLRNWPVIDVTALSIDGVTIPESTGPTVYGFFIEPVYGPDAGRAQNLGIIGTVGQTYSQLPVDWAGGGYGNIGVGGGDAKPFSVGIGNIQVSYTYGYAVMNEAWTVPTSNQITPLAPQGNWVSDIGVSYAAGGALTAIASGVPSVGQYLPPSLVGDSPRFYYTFATADEAAGILLNYNYLPYDLEQAAIDQIAERYKYRGRIGQKSQSLGGQETASYMVDDAFTAAIKAALEPFRMVW